MAYTEFMDALKAGAKVWNQYWRDNKVEFPDFQRADFTGMDLEGVDLRGADLREATFRDTNLNEANLTGTNLGLATVHRSDLGGASLINANLGGSKITDSRLVGVRFTAAGLIRASLTNCILDGVNFRMADLSGADISESTFQATNFSEALLAKTNFRRAILNRTIFANNDLSSSLELSSTQHDGPSTVGIDTIYKSGGHIPDRFLREAGVPEEMIELARSIRAGPPIQWHSCFISYSTKDEEFARHLHSRMRQANMRVWFAPEDMKGGKRLHEQLFEAIQLHDRLLIVLSKHSTKSEWVMTEIRKAREVEKKENRRKLFPVRLVDFDTLRGWTCFDADSGKDLAVEVREYFIPDFSNWKDHDAFEKAFVRLQQDLKAEIKN